MSRLYNFTIKVMDFDHEKADDIMGALDGLWPFDMQLTDSHTMEGGGQDPLIASETEDEAAGRFAMAVWEANGSFCHVEVGATYLEDPPCEVYDFDEVMFHDMNKEE